MTVAPVLPSARRAHALEVLAAFQTASDVPELLTTAFEGCDVPPPDHSPRVVVGGGLAGLLLALRLSTTEEAQGITLLESEQTLGGRLYFSTPWHGMGSPRSRFEMLYERSFLGNLKSGPGLEGLAPDALESIARHVQTHLCEEERAFVESFCTLGLGRAMEALTRRCYVVKKEAVPLGAHAAGPTETLTRKDADAMAALLSLGAAEAIVDADTLEPREVSAFARTPREGATKSAEPRVPPAFGESPFWKELHKSQKENLVPLLETLCGFGFARFPAASVASLVARAFDAPRHPIPAWLCRTGGLELALELVLRLRGVRVRTSTRVMRIEKGARGGFSLLLGDDAFPIARSLEAGAVFLCVPLARTFAMLPREALAAGQSRLVTKHRARSLVALEYPDALGCLQPLVEGGSRNGDMFVFPVERARAQITSQGALVVTGWLDFEDSLHAPPVREMIARMRKAAARVLTPEAMRAYAGRDAGVGGLADSKAPRERVVLAPVGIATPQESVAHDLCDDARASWKGLFVCGDGFTVSSLPWKNVIHSVHASYAFAKGRAQPAAFAASEKEIS